MSQEIIQPGPLYYTDPQASRSGEFFKTLLPSLVTTEGVQLMAEKLRCFWLVDLVASHLAPLRRKLPDETFFIVRLVRNQDDPGAVVVFETDTDLPVRKDRLVMTDIGMDVKLYLALGGPSATGRPTFVLMLPSEY